MQLMLMFYPLCTIYMRSTNHENENIEEIIMPMALEMAIKLNKVYSNIITLMIVNL